LSVTFLGFAIYTILKVIWIPILLFRTYFLLWNIEILICKLSVFWIKLSAQFDMFSNREIFYYLAICDMMLCTIQQVYGHFIGLFLAHTRQLSSLDSLIFLRSTILGNTWKCSPISFFAYCYKKNKRPYKKVSDAYLIMFRVNFKRCTKMLKKMIIWGLKRRIKKYNAKEKFLIVDTFVLENLSWTLLIDARISRYLTLSLSIISQIS